MFRPHVPNDPDLHLYYNRARYLNVSTGRFWSMDTFEGEKDSPASLHKYLYASGDPANRIDPGGNADFSIGAVTYAIALGVAVVGGIFLYNSLSYVNLTKFDIETAEGLNEARAMVSEAESAARRNKDPKAFRRVFGDSDPYLISANYSIMLGLLYKPVHFSLTTHRACQCIAEAASTQQPASFDINVSELYFLTPQVLVMDPLLDYSQISKGGAIVHEAAHSGIAARDFGSYDQALKLSGPDSVRNADSYRIFAEHIYVTQ